MKVTFVTSYLELDAGHYGLSSQRPPQQAQLQFISHVYISFFIASTFPISVTKSGKNSFTPNLLLSFPILLIRFDYIYIILVGESPTKIIVLLIKLFQIWIMASFIWNFSNFRISKNLEDRSSNFPKFSKSLLPISNFNIIAVQNNI